MVLSRRASELSSALIIVPILFYGAGASFKEEAITSFAADPKTSGEAESENESNSFSVFFDAELAETPSSAPAPFIVRSDCQVRVAIDCVADGGIPCDQIELPPTQCSVGDKIDRLKFKLVSSTCSESAHSQDEKFFCESTGEMMPSQGKQVRVSCTSGSGPPQILLHDHLTTIGTLVTVESTNGGLPDYLLCEVKTREGNELQQLALDTSGHEDLFLKNTFGMLQLDSCTVANRQSQSCTIPVQYRYSVSNVGSTFIDVVQVERTRNAEVLDLTPQGPVTELRAGENEPGDSVFMEEDDYVDICSPEPYRTTVLARSDPQLGGESCVDMTNYVFNFSGVGNLDVDIYCISEDGLECTSLVPKVEECWTSLTYIFEVKNVGTTDLTIDYVEILQKENDLDMASFFVDDTLEPGEKTSVGYPDSINLCVDGAYETTVTVRAKSLVEGISKNWENFDSYPFQIKAESSPSPSNNRLPSQYPSSLPNRPSDEPTHTGTPFPSQYPSTLPNRQSNEPTDALLPSQYPSTLPSRQSNEPTGTPTVAATATATLMATTVPSATPSAMVSAAPSVVESLGPSLVDSALPTDEPTVGPSLTSSGFPSANPSVMASKTPSASPSDIPSPSPSDMPSDMPSASPSAVQSLQPSRSSSSLPTPLSSQSPSAMQSAAPSVVRSLEPSVVFSAISSTPSVQPTNVLSATPTLTNAPVVPGSTSCSANPVCSSLGLVGVCCPTLSGVTLKCCEQSVSTLPPGLNPTETPSFSSAVPSALIAGESGKSSQNPSAMISGSPSELSSASPTSTPTPSPSALPISPPPTANPSGVPTTGEFLIPTSSPSATPNVSPTLSPTTVPISPPPTATPSGVPTKDFGISDPAPSAGPSVSPTLSPADTPISPPPTARPSGSPTTATPNPSAEPKSSSTPFPSALPVSPLPTANPTGLPTTGQFMIPSPNPSFEPDISPTGEPSKSPVEQPTFPLSDSPSFDKSATPTLSSAFPSPDPLLTRCSLDAAIICTRENGESCENIRTPVNKTCTGSKAEALSFVYIPSSWCNNPASQIGFSCTDFNTDIKRPFTVWLKVYAYTDTFYEGAVSAGQHFEVPLPTSRSKIYVSLSTVSSAGDEGTILQIVSLDVACKEDDGITLLKKYGSLQLNGFKNLQMGSQHVLERVHLAYRVENVGHTDALLAMATTDSPFTGMADDLLSSPVMLQPGDTRTFDEVATVNLFAALGERFDFFFEVKGEGAANNLLCYDISEMTLEIR
eukprot:scaffold2047_cov129-Cylindrotheca_fusiformis.AAC.37